MEIKPHTPEKNIWVKEEIKSRITIYQQFHFGVYI